MNVLESVKMTFEDLYGRLVKSSVANSMSEELKKIRDEGADEHHLDCLKKIKARKANVLNFTKKTKKQQNSRIKLHDSSEK